MVSGTDLFTHLISVNQIWHATMLTHRSWHDITWPIYFEEAAEAWFYKALFLFQVGSWKCFDESYFFIQLHGDFIYPFSRSGMVLMPTAMILFWYIIGEQMTIIEVYVNECDRHVWSEMANDFLQVISTWLGRSLHLLSILIISTWPISSQWKQHSELDKSALQWFNAGNHSYSLIICKSLYGNEGRSHSYWT